MTPDRLRRQAAKLAAIGREVEQLVAAAGQQADLFDRAWHTPSTAAAMHGHQTITITVHEAHALITASRGSDGRDVTSREHHAMLVIALRHALDQLCQGSSGDTAAAIAAVQLVGRTTRGWLQHADRRALKHASAAARRQMAAQAADLEQRARGEETPAGVNIIHLKRHFSAPRHNSPQTPAESRHGQQDGRK
jgi:hypothetical protein